MRQARTVTTRIGGIIKQEYRIIFEHNHSQVWRDHHLIFDGYETEGYKMMDQDIQSSKEIAKQLGLSFEIIE